VGGDLFEEECPHDEPPRLTLLAFGYVGRNADEG
jgi:hypothetical protein